MKNFIKITVILFIYFSNIAFAQKAVPFGIHAGYKTFGPLSSRTFYDENIGQVVTEYFTTPGFGYKRGEGQGSISIDCGVVHVNDTIKWEATYFFIRLGTDAGKNLHTISADTIPIGAGSFHFEWDNSRYWEMNAFYIPTVPGFYLYKCLYHSPHMRGCFSVVGISTNISTETQKIEHEPMLYPNPAQDFVNVILHTTDKYVMDVINTNGEILKTERTEGVSLYKMDISDLPKGNYYIHVKYCACQKPKKGCTGASQKYRFIKS